MKSFAYQYERWKKDKLFGGVAFFDSMESAKNAKNLLRSKGIVAMSVKLKKSWMCPERYLLLVALPEIENPEIDNLPSYSGWESD